MNGSRNIRRPLNPWKLSARVIANAASAAALVSAPFFANAQTDNPQATAKIAERAYGDSPTQEEFSQFIQSFASSPKSFIDYAPQKRSNSEESASSVFSAEEIANEDFINIKDGFRTGEIFEPMKDLLPNLKSLNQKICDQDGCLGDQSLDGRRPPRLDVDRFFDSSELPVSQRVLTLDGMQENGLMSARLAVEPWSDDYWALYKGVLGARYADDDFVTYSDDFMSYKNYVMNPANTFFALLNSTGGSKDRNMLSPSEKYDLLIGHTPGATDPAPQGLLTPTMWAQGQGYYNTYKKVETWMGICHGWAPAAYMVKTPQKKVDVTLEDNSKLTFYPSDIKALSSYLWSSIQYDSTWLGGRCKKKGDQVEKDPDSGAIIDDDCFDVNPKNWHITVVNQIGIAKRSFVLDATYDYEVWNQPVYSYKYTYFNPETGELTDDIEKASVRKGSEWVRRKDPFRAHRKKGFGRRPDKIVGVRMDVTYMVETRPDQSEYQSNGQHTVTYIYDLEIMESGGRNVIVGGEWYSNKHPDFLWNPRPGTRLANELELTVGGSQGLKRFDPYLPGQSLSSNISSQSSISESGKEKLRKNFGKYAQWGDVSGWIVEGLVNASSQKDE